MQKIKDVLRMHLLGGVGSCRQLARAVGCEKSAVADCLRRAKVANLSDWASVAELDEVELSRRLYPSAGITKSRPSARPLPDWTKVREELARADHQMTLALLWEEYKGQHPATSTRSSPNCIDASRNGCRWCCASRTGPARNASWTSA